MSKIVFDDSRHPLISIVWPPEYTTADVADFVVQAKKLVMNRERIAIINDVLRTRAPTAIERKMITDGVGATSNYYRNYVAGWSDVLHNPFIRGVITAILWVSPPVYPHKVHVSLAEAEVWCRAQLEQQPLRHAGS